MGLLDGHHSPGDLSDQKVPTVRDVQWEWSVVNDQPLDSRIIAAEERRAALDEKPVDGPYHIPEGSEKEPK
jgi:hypothetical protein